MGAESGHVDPILPCPGIQPVHLKIVEQKGLPILINDANDPFVSVNGSPFGKKRLNSGDIIAIHEITLLFENLTPYFVSDKTQEEALEDKIKKQGEILCAQPLVSSTESSDLTSFSLPFEQEVKALGEEELETASLELYLKQLESISAGTLALSSSSLTGVQKQIEGKKKASLKDDYLRDLDDDNQREGKGPFGKLKEPSHLYQAWKWILLFIFCLFAISGAIGTVIYFSVSDKTEVQEMKAAQGVADVAIALTHAQFNQLKPHNHNWSDVDFLKHNLQAILPDTPSHANQIDPQGQFNCCPYSLRIYTSGDLSHFLLIAQPAPSWLNWLIPQSLIVVDSHLMELRILKDARSLNRLLANPDPLDGLNGKEMTSLIKSGGLIRLSTLASDSGTLDFAPPKNLAWMRPGAENTIYNAPRYYRLGHPILQKAMALCTSKSSSQEVTALKQELENLSSLNHFILYSDQGKKSAKLARQGLMMFAPSDKLLFGYLLFNAQGKIHQVHLLKDEEDRPIVVHEAKQNVFQEIVKEEGGGMMHPFIDSNHPIYIQLKSVVMARQKELKPLVAALSNLTNQELTFPHPRFQVEFQNLSHAYLMTNAKHKQSIKETLEALYHQYQDMPIDEFLTFMTALHLEHLIQHEKGSLSILDEDDQQNMEMLLTSIENSQSLAELDNLTHIAASWLNFDDIKTADELIKYQNLLRNHVLEQLERYLLADKKPFLVKYDDRAILEHILDQERLIKPEEKDFFLGEFEEMIAMQQRTHEE